MTSELEALGRRAASWPNWRWMPGMLNGRDESRHMGALQWAWRDPYRHHALGVEIDDWPDLSDPATMGCLTALVAQAHGVTIDDVHVVRTTGMVWSVWVFRGDDSSYRVATHEPSRAEALVAALEAAP